MFSDSDLQNIVKAKINNEESLGEQVGGSGHLAYVEYEIEEISQPKKVKIDKRQGWEITYYYTIIVTTEFTIYPDNPPYRYKYKKTIIVDDGANIIAESQKENVETDPRFCSINSNSR